MSSMRDLINIWWPVVLPVLAVAGSTVRTETIVSAQQVQIDDLRANGAPTIRERMTRVETKLDGMDRTLQRIETKLDQAEGREK